MYVKKSSFYCRFHGDACNIVVTYSFAGGRIKPTARLNYNFSLERNTNHILKFKENEFFQFQEEEKQDKLKEKKIQFGC